LSLKELSEQNPELDMFTPLSGRFLQFLHDRIWSRLPGASGTAIHFDIIPLPRTNVNLARTRDLLPPAQQELLRELLNHCDLVKFAELDVGKPEIQRTFDACKTIIETTKVEEERQREPKPEPEAA